jgi:tetratricopeptide (TPR) repeat protein
MFRVALRAAPAALLCLSSLLASSFATPSFGEEFKTARDARAAANKHLKAKDYAQAQAPLEAALKLTPETEHAERVDIYRALIPSYRLLPEVDKMREAVEYIQTNGDSAIERGLIARSFANFLKQRGKSDWAAEIYETELKTNAKSPTALAVLSTIYADGTDEQKTRAAKLEGELKTLNRERAAAKAERLEKVADQEPTSAATKWKDVAKAWLEAEDKDRARAAVEKSKKGFPESRSPILGMYWHEGLGDVLMQLGDTQQAALHYEEAVGLASAAPLKNPLRAKLAKAQAKTGTLPKP